MKTKIHLYMYYNIVINKYDTGEVYFSNFENVIQKYINDYNKKFNLFSILIRCKFDQENIFISINNKTNYVFLYKFKDIGPIFINIVRVKKREIIFIIFFFKKIYNSIINDLTITIFSESKNMTSKHRFHQPRSVLESEILKRISNLDFVEKISKYNFLTTKYELL